MLPGSYVPQIYMANNRNMIKGPMSPSYTYVLSHVLCSESYVPKVLCYQAPKAPQLWV